MIGWKRHGFGRPRSAARVGNRYVAEAEAVRRVDVRSGTVRTLAGSGSRGLSLGALPASVNVLAGLAVLDDRSLHVANRSEAALVRAHP